VSTSDLNIVIIGAGPYGLSIAAHLRTRKIPFRIFGEPMLTWRKHMPKGMLLKSEGFASCLYDPGDRFTLAHYCRETGLPYADVGYPVPLETFVAYGLEFQRRLVPELEHATVVQVTRASTGFEITTSEREVFRAKQVIVAVGITHFGYLPPVLSGHAADLITHSSQHVESSEFAGKRVAIIGGGSSAVDIAVLLSEAGADVQLIARRETIAFHPAPEEPRPLLRRIIEPRSGLGVGWRSRLCTDAPLLFHAMPHRFRVRVVKSHLGPSPGWFMRDRLSGRVSMHLNTTIGKVDTSNRHVSLTLEEKGGARRTMEVDHVIGATGYRVALDRLTFIEDRLRDQIGQREGAPVLNGNFECSIPGIYMVGLVSANCFGPLTRFAFGARFTARRLTRHLAARG